MVISNFNFKNLLKIGFVGTCMFATQSFAYASPAHSQANQMPLVMSNHLLGLQLSAGTLIVDNLGLSSNISQQVQIVAYSSTNCTTGYLGGLNSMYTEITWTPQTYNILAVAVYSILLGGLSSGQLNTVQSFDFGPYYSVAPDSISTFNPEYPCFKATCNTSTLECTAVNDATPQTVSLVNPA